MISIDNYAPVKCIKNIAIRADIALVWETLTEIDKWKEWQTDISNSTLNGELKPEVTFDWKIGGTKIHSTLHTVKPNNYLGWTGKTMGIYAIHNWILWVEDGKTIVQAEESMEGFLASLFKNIFNKNIEIGMEKWLELLKKKCESL